MAQDLTPIKENLPEQLSDAQLSFIRKRTPAAFIKTRAGRGGGSFSYVEIGYVMQMLNSLFGFGGWDWTYELVEALSYPKTRQIVVNGTLTVKLFNRETKEFLGTITKQAAGGKDVSFQKNTETPVDLGDDLKAASADALKKASSMLGIAADVYYPDVYKAIEAIQAKRSGNQPITAEVMDSDVERAMEAEDPGVRTSLQRAIFAQAKGLAIQGKLDILGKTDEQKKEELKKFLATYAINISSFSKDPIENLQLALDQLQRLNEGGV